MLERGLRRKREGRGRGAEGGWKDILPLYFWGRFYGRPLHLCRWDWVGEEGGGYGEGGCLGGRG